MTKSASEVRKCVFIALLFALIACDALAPPHAAVSWNGDSNALIIRATFCCGLVPIAVVENYIPDAQVWGNGRIVWVETSRNGQRRVLEGKLTADQINALLARVVSDGFFAWKDHYADSSVTDQPSKCLSVSLTNQTKSVSEFTAKIIETFAAYSVVAFIRPHFLLEDPFLSARLAWQFPSG